MHPPIGSFVSALAVLISLVYLSLQVRQAERNQQASIRAARASRSVDLFMGSTEPSVAEAVSKGMHGSDDISDTQVFQFTSYGFARFCNAEDAFYQHKEGLLNAFAFDGIANGLKSSFASPGMRALYRRQRTVLGRDFVEYADKLLAATAVTRNANLSTQFKIDVAAELSASDT
jgi:hypothetical protein